MVFRSRWPRLLKRTLGTPARPPFVSAAFLPPLPTNQKPRSKVAFFHREERTKRNPPRLLQVSLPHLFDLVSFSIWYSNRPLLRHMFARSSGRHEQFIVLTVLFLVMDFECGCYILSRSPRFMSPSLLQNLWSD